MVRFLASGSLQCGHFGVPTGRVIESLTSYALLVLVLGTEESFSHRMCVKNLHSVVSLDPQVPNVSAFAM
jgi:hypothetical protein